MALPALLNQVAAFQAIVQAAAGTAQTLTAATDGVYPYLGDGVPPAPAPVDYIFDGNLGRDVKTLFPTKRTAPNGRSWSMPFPTLFKGAGTAYTTSAVLPPNEVHLMLQAAGFDATFNTNKWDYTPTAAGTGYKFLTFGYFAQGKQHILSDALADWKFTFDGLGVPVHTFDLVGIGAAGTTLSLPATTYPYATIVPPVAAGCTVSIGDFVTPVTKGGSFALNRNMGSPRTRITASDGHMGFVPGGMAPELTFMIEQTALVGSPYHTSAGLAPDLLREAATAITVSLRVGSATANKWLLTLSNAQLVKMTPAFDDNIAMWEVTFRGTGSTAVAVAVD